MASAARTAHGHRGARLRGGQRPEGGHLEPAERVTRPRRRAPCAHRSHSEGKAASTPVIHSSLHHGLPLAPN